MTNIIELEKEIKTYLETKCANVFNETADDSTNFPYVVFSFPNSIGHIREDFIFRVDVWDNQQDTARLETLVNNIDGDGDVLNATGLNMKNIFVEGKVAATVYKENRQTIPDNDKTLHRRQLVYTVTTY